MIEIAICDDNPEQLKEIKRLTREIMQGGCKTFCYRSSDELISKLMDDDLHCRVVLLDIDLGDNQNGIQLAKKINSISTRIKIIFVTGYERYMLDVYEAEHVYFVMKPIETHKLQKALNKALESLSTESVTVSEKRGMRTILQEDIIYIERIKRVSYIHCASELISTSETLEVILSKVNGVGFFSSHRSFLINFKYVEQFKHKEFIMANQAVVPISRNLYSQTKIAFSKYIGETIL